MDIALIRVDHRLVHGQVTTGWTRAVNADAIAVVNDRVAGDAFEANLMGMAVPHGVTSYVVSVAEGADKIRSGGFAGRVLLLVATPIDLEPLLDAGLAVEEVNIGGVRSPGADIKLTKEVHATAEELAAWKKLDEHGVKLSVQWLPGQRRRSLNDELARR